MPATRKLAVVLAGLYVLLVVLFSALGLVLWLDMTPRERQMTLDLLENRYGLALFVILISWAILGMAVQALYRAYVIAPRGLREEAGILLNVNPQRRLVPRGAPEIRALAEAINILADQRDILQNDVEQKIREARSSVEEEKNRLAALMSELAQSVVVCNLDGRILLYNSRARLQFKMLADAGGTSGGLIGLGRSIFAVFDRSLISHALDDLQQRLSRNDAEMVTRFVTATRTGQLMRVQMAPVLSASGQTASVEKIISGYVLVVENITRAVEAESRRDELLQSLTEGSRASLASIRAAVENLVQYPDMDSAHRDRFLGVMAEEVHALSGRLDRAATEYADSLKTRWPLEEILGADLIAAARRRIESRVQLQTKVEEVDTSLWIKADGYSLIQGLTYLAGRLKDEFDIREVRFRLNRSGRLAHLDMIWSGTPIAVETLHTWELEPMRLGGESSPLTLRDVTDRHGGEIWYQLEKASHRAFFRLLVPVAAAPEVIAPSVLPKGESRPEYYDFDLFRTTDETRELDERLLSELRYTVFDTETTGLQPAAGDEIIQIGAVRIVNGRVLQNEAFDQLVDPRRPLTAESVGIHGITGEMLRDQPTAAAVLPSFHEFCEDTVLVAHNAAFDMRFLEMKEEATGVCFRQPVLDTLLLSAVIHPSQEGHKLEAIAERLGVSVIGRHTALGDAIVTAEVFVKMIPLLAQMGIHTLREAREASERTYYARVRY